MTFDEYMKANSTVRETFLKELSVESPTEDVWDATRKNPKTPKVCKSLLSTTLVKHIQWKRKEVRDD